MQKKHGCTVSGISSDIAFKTESPTSATFCQPLPIKVVLRAPSEKYHKHPVIVTSYSTTFLISKVLGCFIVVSFIFSSFLFLEFPLVY